MAKAGRRGKKKHRAGTKRYRSRNPNRDTEHLIIFFGNISSCSAHATTCLAERTEDVLLTAETHQNLQNKHQMIREYAQWGFQTTGSPAMHSDRSATGTVAGTAAAVRNHIDNRPLSACVDPQGKITPNACITGRAITTHEFEILTLAGYLVGGGA